MNVYVCFALLIFLFFVGLAGRCHVYEKKGDIYNCVLGMVDVARGLNTYYKLQVLEPNHGKKYVCDFNYSCLNLFN